MKPATGGTQALASHEDTAAPAAYRRGVPLATAARGILRRFLPASALTAIGAFAVLIGAPWPSGAEWLSLIRELGLLLVPLAAGYGIGLEALRRQLYPDAGLDGRRSVIAGVMAPMLVWSYGALGLPIGSWQVRTFAFFVMGAVIALLMFFPWLAPSRPTETGDQ